MKLKPVTTILLLTAVVLGGVVYLTETRSASQQEAADASSDQQPLFKFQEADVRSLEVKTQTRTLKFERDKDDKWQMQEPEKAPAEEAAVAYLLNLLATGQSERSITASKDDRTEFGLDKPLATITVTLKNNETHNLVLGGFDFNRSSLYAQVAPPADTPDTTKVMLVSTDFNSAVRRPTAEWKQQQTEEGKPTESPKADESPSPEAKPSESASPEARSSASPSPQESPRAASPSPKP